MQLYHHKTDGGAEYLFDTFIEFMHEGKLHREGAITPKTKYVVRIDGDVTKDAELDVRDADENNPDIVRRVIRDVLRNDVCSAQSLDVSEDRKRVQDEIMRALKALGTVRA